MSSTTQSTSSLHPAPWKSDFLGHLSKLKSPEFVLSTITHAPSNAASPTPYLPRARYCIFRGFFAELPENKHNTATQNPRVYESELPTFTTDVRMQKVGELFGTSEGKAESEEQVQGSGGGGPVEAVWWIAETGVQWRMKGRAYVICGEDIEGGNDSGVRTVKSEVGKRMRIVDPAKEQEWSWRREYVAQFGNLSPGMRGP
jgi:pyridoxamine 5'-phosphate oxidase